MKMTIFVSDEETGEVLFREDRQVDMDSLVWAAANAARVIWRKRMSAFGKDWRNEQDPLGRPASSND